MRPILLATLAFLTLPSLTVAVPIPAGDSPFPEPLRKLPKDTMIFLHVKFSRIWDAPQLRPLRDALGGENGELSKQLRAEIGLSLDEIDTLTEWLTANPTGDPSLAGNTGMIVTSRKPIDRRAVLKAYDVPDEVLGTDPLPDVIEVGDTERRILRFVGDRSFSVMDEEFERLHRKTNPEPADGRGSAPIRSAMDKSDLVTVWMSVPRVKALVVPILPIFPEAKAIKPLLDARDVLFIGRLEETLVLKAKVTGTADEATEMEAAAKAGLKSLREVFEAEVAQAKQLRRAGTQLQVFLSEQLVEALKEAAVGREGSSIHATVKLGIGTDVVRGLRAAVEEEESTRLPRERANNLKQLVLSMHNYESSEGRFPPIGTLEKNGSPRLSWRVAILPYIEEGELYKQFKLDEPWDSEHNLKLLKKMPDAFALPGVTKPGETKTYYRVFAGKGTEKTALDRTEGARIAGITDGTSNTLMIVEAEEAVPWTKPEPLEYDSTKAVSGLRFDEKGRCVIAMCDGSVRVLRKKTKQEILHLLITRDDGQAFQLP